MDHFVATPGEIIWALIIALVVMLGLYFRQRRLFLALSDYALGIDEAQRQLTETSNPRHVRYELELEHKDCDCAYSGGVQEVLKAFDRGRASELGS